MAITNNEIYARLRATALSVFPNAYVTGRYVAKLSQYPCVYIREIDRSRPRQYIQLDYKDVQWESVYEIQVASNNTGGASAEAYSIYEAMCQSMNTMFFRETSRSQIDTGTVFTVIGRFRRVVGGGDAI